MRWRQSTPVRRPGTMAHHDADELNSSAVQCLQLSILSHLRFIIQRFTSYSGAETWRSRRWRRFQDSEIAMPS
jgi:hypothetical protein